jgi:hypothetical protein
VKANVLVKLAVACSLATPPLAAQSVGDRVGEHVGGGLDDKSKKKKKKKKRRRSGGGGSRDRDWSQPHYQPAPAPAEEEVEEEPSGPELPQRVFGGRFKLDPMASIAYRGWRPQSFPSIDVSTENTFTWSVGARASLWIVSIHRAHYESNAAASPRRDEASVAGQAATAKPVAAWVLGVVGFPVNWVLEPIIRYEARAFQSVLTPSKEIRVIPREARKEDDLSIYPTTTDKLLMTSAFETLVIGMMYHHENDPSGLVSMKSGSLPRMYFGLGVTQYSKPYMVRVGNIVLDDLLFDARLRGAGLALGLETVQKPERFFVELSTQFGIGEVKLTDHYTVNEELPPGWAVGYAQGDLSFGYIHPLLRTRPTLLGGLAASIGGASFFYFKPISSEDEEERHVPLNWDLLWGLRAFVTLPL